MRKGILVYIHPESGLLSSHEIDLPIEDNMRIVAWSLDMCRKINEHSKFRRFLLRIVLGKYAWRELIGLRDAIDGEWDTEMDYSCERCDYHKEKAKW